jgi:hypothetical protein
MSSKKLCKSSTLNALYRKQNRKKLDSSNKIRDRTRLMSVRKKKLIKKIAGLK